MAGISPADCVAPAFNLMQKRLFRPFRFGYWSRIAVLGVLTGELSTSGNGGGGQHSTAAYGNAVPGHGFDPAWIAQHWNLILGVIGAIFVLGLVFFYVGSVLRFVLYEAVLRDKASFHEGFARWREQGSEYFSFRLMLVIPYVALAVYLVGLPLLKVLKEGGGGAEIVTAVAQLAGAVLFVVLLGLLLLVVMVFTKDFVVPQMMFERVTCTEGWGRLWTRIRSEPMNYAGYVLLKIVLAIAALDGICNLNGHFGADRGHPGSNRDRGGRRGLQGRCREYSCNCDRNRTCIRDCGARDHLLRGIRRRSYHGLFPGIFHALFREPLPAALRGTLPATVTWTSLVARTRFVCPRIKKRFRRSVDAETPWTERSSTRR